MEKEVALTFDDAPSTFTGEVLEILANYEVSATFFLSGFPGGKISPDCAPDCSCRT